MGFFPTEMDDIGGFCRLTGMAGIKFCVNTGHQIPKLPSHRPASIPNAVFSSDKAVLSIISSFQTGQVNTRQRLCKGQQPQPVRGASARNIREACHQTTHSEQHPRIFRDPSSSRAGHAVHQLMAGEIRPSLLLVPPSLALNGQTATTICPLGTTSDLLILGQNQ